MYGIVLATALTAGSATPEWFFHGCHGCCGCYGCYGCCGCYGCYGCCGCYGGCCGCYGGCCGCYGGCWGYYAPVVKVYPVYPVYYYGYYGCCGCCGYVSPPVIVPPATVPPPKMKAIEGTKETGAAQMPATVLLKAPADVKITVNGQETSRRSTEESYLTPDLPVGRTFAYIFSAEATRDGKKVTKTERITVRAGEQTEVDFTNFDHPASLTDVAHVTVTLPENARLFVNDVAVSASGTQTFETPKLQKGRKFFYTVKAEVTRDGKKVTESQRVSVEAGKTVTVDFVKAKGTLTASR